MEHGFLVGSQRFDKPQTKPTPSLNDPLQAIYWFHWTTSWFINQLRFRIPPKKNIDVPSDTEVPRAEDGLPGKTHGGGGVCEGPWGDGRGDRPGKPAGDLATIKTEKKHGHF